MRFNRKMRSIMIIISLISLLFTIGFSILQAEYPSCVVIAILNNVSICILTGCFIALIQSIIGYKQAKREGVYQFYKTILSFEEKLTYFPYRHAVFTNAIDGLKDILDISSCYTTDVQNALRNIDFTDKDDIELNAVKRIISLYNEQTKTLQQAEEALCQSIEAIQEAETDAIIDNCNEKIKIAIDAMAKAYNNEDTRKGLNEANGVIEMYLYGEKVVK